MSKTLLFKIGFDGENLSRKDWKPWKYDGKDTPQMVQALAVNQAIRFRGGIHRPTKCEVWRHDPEKDLTRPHKDNQPATCKQTLYHLTPCNP
jgi:hypothetical protein